MPKDNYSAGMVSKPFWFIEFKKFIQLLNDGCSYEEIKRISIEENLFGVPKEYRAKEIFNGLSSRAKVFDEGMIKLFCSTDLSSSKFLAMLAVIKTDRLFFEFMYEVYREKIMFGVTTLEDRDINIFLKNKQMQSEKVAGWKDCTLDKLKNSYVNYLSDSGLILRVGSVKNITPPVLDISVEQYLLDHDMRQYLSALTGVN